MKKKALILSGIFLLLIVAVTVIFVKINNKIYAVYENGQMGIVTGNTKVFIEDQEVEVYQTYSGPVKIFYESYNLDNSYNNTIVINDKHEIPLKAKSDENALFITNEVSILGLNIVDGKLKLTFKSGNKYGDNLNTFSLRNVYIQINGKKIWSDEYPESDYLNEPLNFGENEINPDLRFGYGKSDTLTFTVNKKMLDAYGFVVTKEFQKPEITLKINNKEKTIKNKAFTDIDVNINNGEIISESKVLKVSKTDNISSFNVKMDGVLIPSDLKLTKNAWAEGEHSLSIEAVNKYGFKINKTIAFTLPEINSDKKKAVEYDAYQRGVATSLYSGIDNLGVRLDDESSLTEIDENYLLTPFSNSPVLSFTVTDSEDKALIWHGKANKGRTVFMQLYNHEREMWENVSTKIINADENVTLGYDYSGQDRYVKNNKVYVRISSVISNIALDNVTKQLYHLSDIQYIIQMLAKSGTDSVIGKQALDALNSMVNYLINQYETNNLEYFLFTGDFVQQQRGVTIEEWEYFETYVLNPLLEAGIPFGVSSGNHDVGGVSSYNSEGANALDDKLVYDYYTQYLGESVFENFSYYGESYQNNRSHYDLLNINGHEFLFMYLGWGSSISGIHVSEKDLNWARTILQKFPDKTVVLATHEYMSNKGLRSVTGEYVFQNLVKNYDNIKFVFSGHINGTSKRIDALDDNGDGINDRLVLQLLTDFQEEENLFGATFIRKMGLDFINNVMYFDLYSPYFKDSDLILPKDNEYYKTTKAFYYAFDLNNSGYGILTDYFG